MQGCELPPLTSAHDGHILLTLNDGLHWVLIFFHEVNQMYCSIFGSIPLRRMIIGLLATLSLISVNCLGQDTGDNKKGVKDANKLITTHYLGAVLSGENKEFLEKQMELSQVG